MSGSLNFNDGPPVWDGSADPARIQDLQARPPVAEGDQFVLTDPDDGVIPFTVRRIVTDGTTSAAFWVADQEWEPTCASRGDCLTQEMVDAVAERFSATASATTSTIGSPPSSEPPGARTTMNA